MTIEKSVSIYKTTRRHIIDILFELLMLRKTAYSQSQTINFCCGALRIEKHVISS